MGIGGRLAFGLAAVAGVILIGHTVATETTRRAVEAVRSMQQDHEPIARRAGTVVEKLVAYDRSVSEYLQAARAPDMSSIISAHAVLETALNAYFQSSPSPHLTPATSDLRARITSHMTRGRALAAQAAQRADWVARRHASLDELQKRVTSAGGEGVRIDRDQVFARRSLAELTAAANALRGFGGAGSGVREEKDFAAVLARHAGELARSPGRAWLDLVREDFNEAVRLRTLIEKFDVINGTARREFLDDGVTLLAGAQQELQAPARRALLMPPRTPPRPPKKPNLARSHGPRGDAVVVMVSIALMISITRRPAG